MSRTRSGHEANCNASKAVENGNKVHSFVLLGRGGMSKTVPFVSHTHFIY